MVVKGNKIRSGGTGGGAGTGAGDEAGTGAAGRGSRIIAGSIDSLIAGALITAGHLLSSGGSRLGLLSNAAFALIASLFILMRDAGGPGPGKRIAGFEPSVLPERGRILRNITLAIAPGAVFFAQMAAFLVLTPLPPVIIALFVAPIMVLGLLGSILLIIEILLVLAGRRRLGERLASSLE